MGDIGGLECARVPGNILSTGIIAVGMTAIPLHVFVCPATPHAVPEPLSGVKLHSL